MSTEREFPYDRIWDMVIIGAGCAGMGTAIYSARNNFDTLILEKDYPGGVLAQTAEVENYPGFFDPPIEGMELTEKFRKHAEHFGTEFYTTEATGLESDGPYRVVTTKEGRKLVARTVVVAIGTKTRELPCKNHDKFFGNGLSYCGTCDAPFFKDDKVVVVGGGESAFEEADFLSDFASEVYLVHRRQGFRATPRAVDRLKANDNVEFILDTVVTEINGNGTVESVKLQDVNTEEERDFETDGVFVFIGYIPQTEWLDGYLELDEGYIDVNYQQETSVDGVYAAGDISSGAKKQAVVSCGHGATAAINARSYVDTIDWPHIEGDTPAGEILARHDTPEPETDESNTTESAEERGEPATPAASGGGE